MLKHIIASLGRRAKGWVTTWNTIRYRVELAAILRLLKGQSASGSLLDAGAGSGEMSARLFECGFVSVITGVEPFDDSFQKLQSTYSLIPGAIAVQSSIEAMPFGDCQFDVVLCTQVLEHIRDHEAAARELVRVAKPGGLLIVSVPFVPEDWRPEQCIHHDPIGHVRPGYTLNDLSRLLGRFGCVVLGYGYFLTEQTCDNLKTVGKLGLLGKLVPVAVVDAERRLTEAHRQASHPGGIVVLFRKTGDVVSLPL